MLALGEGRVGAGQALLPVRGRCGGRLRRLRLFAVSGPAVAELRARPGLDVTVTPGPGEPAEIVHGLPIRPAADGQWWLRGDLTGRLRADTNADAEQAVLAAVAEQAPELARRLSVDSEADAVQISAADPADLRAVAAVIAGLSGPG